MAAVPSPTHEPIGRSFIPAFLRDIRVLQVIGQIVFAIVLVVIASAIWSSILSSLNSRNLAPTFTFLQNRSGFDISEHPEWYSSNSTYGDAFRVGLTNSLRIIVIGLALTTILGILGGIFLLSSNWLIRTITRTVVEVLRNIPLLVQLFVWYFVIMLSLPLFQSPLAIPPEGISLVSIRLGLYLVAALIAWFWLRREPMGSSRRAVTWTGLAAAVVGLEIAFRLAATQPGWAGLYGSGNFGNLGFLIYLAISLALLAGAWFYTPSAIKWQCVGLAGGQLVGGLLFYFGVIPNSSFRVEIYPAVLLSNRGLVFPEIIPTARFNEWIIFVIVGVILAAIIWIYSGHVTETTGRVMRRGWFTLLSVVGFTLIGWILVTSQPTPPLIPVVNEEDTTTFMSIPDARAAGLLTDDDERLYSEQPLLFLRPVQRTNRSGIVSGLSSGAEITPQYMALLIGLVVYTAAFIAEIVRAGIMAVPRGQIEASRALGLSTAQTLQLVILPQALRVIIPPLGNQYLNLSKNSSLAVAVGYADLVLVTETIMNQSGQSVTGITMIMLTYLAISLTIAAIVNLVNRRFQLVTR
jgi:His/Glu/Gln/Arg/opine family amino acid ABC transporter permease subunit